VVPTVNIEGNHGCARPKWEFVAYYGGVASDASKISC
jgi:hypothetical protein